MKALNREPVDRRPIWIMRQAGRYLPEYRAIRKEAGNFLNLCKTPELACQATLLPINKFKLDAAILFSDILMIPDEMGLGLHFIENEGPKFKRVIQSKSDLDKLIDIDMESNMPYIMQSISMIKKELPKDIPLIGFAGSPWTVATYMVEGQTSKQHNKIRQMMYSSPEILHSLLNTLSIQTTKYLQAQVNAGADCVMLFDTWGGVLSDRLYKEFSLSYMSDIISTLDVPVIMFTKNGGRCIVEQANTGCAALGVDWTVGIESIKAQVGSKVALQGNLDPCVLYADKETIISEANMTLDAYGDKTGHIFNLGHGITPDIEPEKVQILIEAVHNYDKNSSVSGNL